jgi:heme/copper-type cytochrome/quinol oxidase subunit 2
VSLTDQSPEQTLIWICVGAALIVFVSMLYSVASFRDRRPGRMTTEVLWALIPILIVIVGAAPALTTMLSASARSGIAAVNKNVAAAPVHAAEAPQKPFHDGAVPL